MRCSQYVAFFVLLLIYLQPVVLGFPRFDDDFRLAESRSPMARQDDHRPLVFRDADEADDVERPVAQDPVAQDPVVQDPVAQEPVKQEPVKQEPVKQEPVKQEPVKQAPVKGQEVG